MPPTMAGNTAPAWFAKDPYQGICPRNFAHLGRSESRNPAADRGPPRVIAATIGAMATAWCDLEGSRTGSAEASRVSAVQKATPEDLQFSRLGKCRPATQERRG